MILIKKHFSIALFFIISTTLIAQESENDEPFIYLWYVENAGDSLTIPTKPGLSYNYDVSWGDGVFENGLTGSATHQYDHDGHKQIIISGDFPAIYFNLEGDRLQMAEILQWGDLKWQTMEKAFMGCVNLIIKATDAPDLSEVENTSYMFAAAPSINQDIGHWDVSNVTDMSHMFREALSFNQDISQWDVSNVTNMSNMFRTTFLFNQSLDDWDVSNVTDMSGMFNQAFEFNKEIGSWDVGNVTNMSNLFAEARQFNQDIGNWDVSQVRDMSRMFAFTNIFNHDLSTWDVSQVENMRYMFYWAGGYDQDMGNWNIENITDMTFMLKECVISTDSYDNTLIGWSAQENIPKNITFGATGLSYCNATNARSQLTNEYNWKFIGDKKAANCTVDGINDQLALDFSVFPNPAQDRLNIFVAPSLSNPLLEVYDLTGNKVISSNSVNTLDISTLPDQTYMLKLVTDNGYSTLKFTKSAQ